MKVLKDHAAPMLYLFLNALFGISIVLKERGFVSHYGYSWLFGVALFIFLAYQVYENREGFKLFGK